MIVLYTYNIQRRELVIFFSTEYSAITVIFILIFQLCKVICIQNYNNVPQLVLHISGKRSLSGTLASLD